MGHGASRGAGDPENRCPQHLVISMESHKHQTPEPEGLATDPGSTRSAADLGQVNDPFSTSVSPSVKHGHGRACLVRPVGRERQNTGRVSAQGAPHLTTCAAEPRCPRARAHPPAFALRVCPQRAWEPSNGTAREQAPKSWCGFTRRPEPRVQACALMSKENVCARAWGVCVPRVCSRRLEMAFVPSSCHCGGSTGARVSSRCPLLVRQEALAFKPPLPEPGPTWALGSSLKGRPLGGGSGEGTGGQSPRHELGPSWFLGCLDSPLASLLVIYPVVIIRLPPNAPLLMKTGIWSALPTALCPSAENGARHTAGARQALE